VLGWPVSCTLAGGNVALRAHHPLVAAGVFRSSHGASASPWTPTITPVSPLDSGRFLPDPADRAQNSPRRRTPRRVPAGRREHELVDRCGMPGTSADARTPELTLAGDGKRVSPVNGRQPVSS
jgi:hypothetical protein